MRETKLLQRRLEKGYTQQKVAEIARVAIRTYQSAEYGQRVPNVDTANRIAQALDTTVDRLFA